MTRADVYTQVTERITEALAKGVVPWRKTWSTVGGPRNMQGKPYRGINVFLLGITGEVLGYGDPRWGTFKALKEAAVRQAKSEGREIVSEVVKTKYGTKTNYYEVVNGERAPFMGGVRKDEKATHVILWKPVKKKKQTDDAEEKDGVFWLLREYAVFNASQADGVPSYDAPKLQEHERRGAAEEIVSGYEDGPEVGFGYRDRAFYRPSADTVFMPNLDQFDSADSFYSTLFHELVHSTGHESRLARKFGDEFGDDKYSREELIAEMGAAMLSALSGVENDQRQIEQSAGYIAHWSQKIKDDPKLIVHAAAAAQKAADRILGTRFTDDTSTTEKEEVTA